MESEARFVEVLSYLSTYDTFGDYCGKRLIPCELSRKVEAHCMQDRCMKYVNYYYVILVKFDIYFEYILYEFKK